MRSENNKMINDKFSCIKEITEVVPVALSTAYQGNEITGISTVLDSWKRQYIPQLQGVVVSYEDISSMSKYAFIKSDYPIIHCNVKATFVLFVPVTGSIVKGKVNRISHNYIGCLVHNTINVAVHRSVNEVNDSNFISIDQEILFEITDLNFKRKIVRVKGKITQDCIKLMDELQMFRSETDNTASHLNSLISLSDEDPERKKSEENLVSSPSLFSGSLSFSEVESIPFKVTKTKKKHKKSGHKVLTLETTINEKNSSSLHLNKDTKTYNLFYLSESPMKSGVKDETCSEKDNNFIDFLSTFEPISENQSLSNDIKEEPLDSNNKKAKKRKLESPNDGLATKKKKTSKSKNKSDKPSNKFKAEKLKRRNKGKSKKDEKKKK